MPSPRIRSRPPPPIQITLTHNDVIIGRTKQSAAHAGNIILNNIILEKLNHYSSIDNYDRDRKANAINTIRKTIKNAGGRFIIIDDAGILTIASRTAIKQTIQRRLLRKSNAKAKPVGSQLHSPPNANTVPTPVANANFVLSKLPSLPTANLAPTQPMAPENIHPTPVPNEKVAPSKPPPTHNHVANAKSAGSQLHSPPTMDLSPSECNTIKRLKTAFLFITGPRIASDPRFSSQLIAPADATVTTNCEEGHTQEASANPTISTQGEEDNAELMTGGTDITEKKDESTDHHAVSNKRRTRSKTIMTRGADITEKKDESTDHHVVSNKRRSRRIATNKQEGM